MSSPLIKRLSPLLLAASGIAFLPHTSRAAVVYVEQDRRVEAAIGSNILEFFSRQEKSAPDFAPFDARATLHSFDEEDFDEVTSTVTQTSRLDPAGAFASGSLEVLADGDFGGGRSLFSTVFDVTGSSHDFTLHYGVNTDGPYNYSPRPSFHATIALRRLGGPGGAAVPVVPPGEFDLFADPNEGPTRAADTESGVLAPGRYSLLFDVKMFPTSYEDSYSASYDVGLELSDTGHPGLPGDANADGTVNAQDLASLRRHFGARATGWSAGDFTADGLVNAADLRILRQYFGQSLTGADIVSPADQAALAAFEASALPEPAAGLLALPTAWLLLTSRRRSK